VVTDAEAVADGEGPPTAREDSIAAHPKRMSTGQKRSGLLCSPRAISPAAGPWV
jgi:hypothetical protein